MLVFISPPTSVSHEFYLLKRIKRRHYKLRRCWTEFCRSPKVDGPQPPPPQHQAQAQTQDTETVQLPHSYTSSCFDLFLQTED